MWSTDHNKILHTSRQLHCRAVCKILLWSIEYIFNQNTATFGRFSKSIEISLVGRAPGFACGLRSLSAECFLFHLSMIIVRRAGLLWSQQDFEWRWSVPLFKCLTVLEFSFILFDLCLLITFFNFIMNYVPIVTFWIFTYHKIWILSIMFCFIWSYWIIYFLVCLEVSWRVVS